MKVFLLSEISQRTFGDTEVKYPEPQSVFKTRDLLTGYLTETYRRFDTLPGLKDFNWEITVANDRVTVKSAHKLTGMPGPESEYDITELQFYAD